MINPKRLVALARKWQRMAVVKQRRISYPTSPDPFVADKGHFVVYTTDKKRFMFPLEYLNRNVFRELLKMSEEEFGHQIQGAITLPCDNTLLEYVISLVRRRIPEELEKNLLTSIVTCHQLASFSLSQEQNQQQTFIYGC
ncbi:Auxin-responsive protein [Melia azedarach]|uniref:Auxin-responsive protein n=1 Tax=Melia azedarach TaxID=155640 RepID=A0ACC1Y073_MELAZ|nr:Auxin-responsive protein [Melia azedarach]